MQEDPVAEMRPTGTRPTRSAGSRRVVKLSGEDGEIVIGGEAIKEPTV
jgi:hypothetical protein